jgi:uncharacterized protein YbjT (DUF2867 family)
MIIVTGATGQFGHDVVERLLDRLPADGLGVSVRDPRKAHDLEERGVRVRRGDFDEPSTLAHAFEDASQVLIVSGPADPAPHRAAIKAAAEAGAQRVLYTSHMGANPASPFRPMPGHAETESDLRAAGVRFTSLRNGFYAATAIQLMGHALHTGELVAPEDGPVSWTAHADLAEAAATALTREGVLDGTTPPLTGSHALGFADIARIASELTGREITRVTVSDDEWKANLVSRGVPEGNASLLLGMFAASRQGEFAAVHPALEELLGRKPTTFHDVLAATLVS